MINNILITGAGGQDGKIILKKIVNKKINLFLISNKFKNKIHNNNTKFFKFNLLQNKKLEKFFKKNKINTILHLASNNPRHGQNNYKKHYLENVKASKNLINSALKYNKKIKFIFCSSSRIFKKKDGLIDEKSTVNKNDFYSKFRIEIHKYLIDLKSKYKNFDFTNAILFNHDSIFRNKKFIIPRVVTAIINRDTIFLNKIIKENIAMDFSHAEDICDALIKIIFSKKKIDNIILSSGKKTKLNNIIKYLIRKNNIKLNLNYSIVKSNKCLIGNNKLAKKIINWKIKKNIFLASQEIYKKNY